MPQFSIEELNTHPLAIYTRESVEARDQVLDEVGRLELLQDDESVTDDERDEAQLDRLELIAVLGRMDEADRAFLARLVLGPFGPKEEVVQRTIELNQALSELVADANRAKAIIQLASRWADGLAAVVTGAAPSMPATVPPEPETV